MIPWETIQQDYVTTDSSYAALARAYGVPRSTLRRRAKAENWQRQREEFRRQAQTARQDRVDRLLEGVLDRLEQALEQVRMQPVVYKTRRDTPEGTVTEERKEFQPGTVVDRDGLRQILAMLKELKALQEEGGEKTLVVTLAGELPDFAG